MFNFVIGSDNDKPDSLPMHWPFPDESDLRERPKRLINVGKEQDYFFKNNFVKTSKYEIYNFLPKFLMEEFHPKTKFANCYFLLVACLQCITAISNTGGIPTVLMPLLFVVFVDAVFQIIEDMKRHQADTVANASPATKIDPVTHEKSQIKWFELQVGDFIVIKSRETIPSDCVILATAEKTTPAQGICYVETKSLDGETNLKIRTALPNTMHAIKTSTDVANISGSLVMEHPNNLIDSFSGVLDLGELGKEPISPNNILLRGCVLRNTEYIIGLVVNTGGDTKIMMSSTETVGKTSSLEALASTQIRRIILLLMFMAFCGAIAQTKWNDDNDVDSIPYLMWHPTPGANFFIAFFYFLLLHATFIPVSLYVSMAVARFFQSMFMNNDEEMYYEPTDTPSSVGTMTLNEELGQISHIFSDKTGTLTCNIMDFRKMSINGVAYGQGITEIGKASWKLQNLEIPLSVLEGERKAQENAVPHVSFYDVSDMCM